MGGFTSYVKSTLANADGNKFTSSALSSFMSSVWISDSQCLTEDDLRLWVAYMILSGFKKTTRKRYFGKVKTIYNEWSSDGLQNPFGKARDAIECDYNDNSTQAKANLEIVPRLLAKNKDSIGWEYINAFFYLLYNVEATLADVINLKFDDPVPDLPQIDDIMVAMKDTKQLKYVFGLNRGTKRAPQLHRELLDNLVVTLQISGMKFSEKFSRESITAIWIAAALRCHIPLNELRSMITDVPAEYAFLSLIRPREISKDRKAKILKTVANSINKKTTNWFVMRMRSGNTPEIIKKAIKENTSGIYDSMMFYSPTHILFREGKGKKKLREEVPYIPGILFFRTRYDQVAPIFAKIGDRAWCMKESNAVDARYSVISQEEMSNFQRCVGQFTDDIRINLIEVSRGLGKGRMVRITAGMMKGYQGKIEDVHDDKGTRIFFLKISNEKALKWTAEVDEAFIEPLNE